MELAGIDVPVAPQHMVYRIPVGDPAKQWTRIFCEWMKSQAIDDHREELSAP